MPRKPSAVLGIRPRQEGIECHPESRHGLLERVGVIGEQDARPRSGGPREAPEERHPLGAARHLEDATDNLSAAGRVDDHGMVASATPEQEERAAQVGHRDGVQGLFPRCG
jgi:hypothetical protein